MKNIKEATDVEIKAALFDIQQMANRYQEQATVLFQELKDRASKPKDVPIEVDEPKSN